MTGLVSASLVGVGGAAGALARHAVGRRLDVGQYPWATFVVNVLGSVVLAGVTVAGTPSEVRLSVGVGACGAFTTFSSFAVETVQLWEAGDRVAAVLNAGGTLAATLLGVGVVRVLAGG